jgi:hypothetical protein
MATQASLRAMYASIASSYSSEDLGWVQFVRDHYYYIKRSCAKVELNPFRHNAFKYRLTDFCIDNNIPMGMEWIVLFVNQLGSEKDFANLSLMLLPDVEVIKKLRTTYDSIESHKKRVREA